LAAVHVFAVHGRDCRLRFLVATHLHKAEALGPAGVPVHNHLRRLHRAVRLEHLFQVTVGNAVAQVAYVQFPAH
jgi:hypothetical protein